MSRIGKLPISIPSDVTVTIQGQAVTVKGKKGELKMTVHPDISVMMEEKDVILKAKKDNKQTNALHGTSRALINNMVNGVTNGYQKKLEVRGVGYRFTIAGKKLNLSLGYSHPVEFKIPEGITITVDEENKNLMIISGIDRQLVGETAAHIREYRKPEPYKGKGIRYSDEHVVMKQGKKAAK